MKLLINIDHPLKHGEEIPGKVGRWCEIHQKIHGRFLICESYPLTIKQAIKKEERNWLYASASYALMFLFFVLLLATGLR